MQGVQSNMLVSFYSCDMEITREKALLWVMQDRTFVVLIVTAGVQHTLEYMWGWNLYGEAVLSVLPVMKSVERNEAAHLGLLSPT